MPYNEEGRYIPSKADNRTNVLGFGEIGGVGQLIYHTFKFKDYELEITDNGIYAHPVCRLGMEPEIAGKDMPTGKQLLVSLYNLAKKINDFSEKKPYTDLIIAWCKEYSHPYFIDDIYATFFDKNYNLSEDWFLIEKDGLFNINIFMTDLGGLYQATAFYFALDQMCLGNDEAALHLSEEGKFFEGLPFFEQYHHDCENQPDIDYSSAGGDLVKEMQLDKKMRDKEDYDPDKFERTPYDYYDELRDKLIDLIPDFKMRLKVNPKTNRIVFSADVHSIFDICWYTLARKIADDVPPDDKDFGIIKDEETEGTFVSCLCCGKAFIRRGNRQMYCGSKECDLARRAKNQRNLRAKKRKTKENE